MSSQPEQQSRVVFWLVAAIFAVLSCIYLANWVVALARPYSIAYEGPIIWACAQLADGHNIYPISGLHHEPWIVTIYPPIFFALGAILTKVFSLGYAPLRAISMCSLVLAAACSYRLFRASDCSKLIALTCLLFFLSTGVLAANSYMARTDMLVIGISIWLMERFHALMQQPEKAKDIRSYVGIFALCLMALFIKQQAFVFVATIVLFLLITAPRVGLQFSGLLLTGFVVTTVILELITQNGFLAHVLFLAPVHSQTAILMANINALGPDLIKILVVLLLAPLALLRMKTLTVQERIPLLLLLISLATMSVSMGIPAASENHAIASIFALSWWLGIALKRLPNYCALIVSLVCCLTFFGIVQFAIFEPQMEKFATKSAALLQQQDWHGQPVLTDDPYLNMLTASQPVIIDCATFLNVWQAKREGMEDLLQSINSQRYVACLINDVDWGKPGTEWWPAPVISALKENYKVHDEKGPPLASSGWLMRWLQPIGTASH